MDKRNKRRIIFLITHVIVLVAAGLISTVVEHNRVKKYYSEESAIIVNLFVVFLILVGVSAIVQFLILSYKLNAYDRLTEIWNSDTILRKGGIMYYRKKMSDYNLMFINIKDCSYINHKVGNKVADNIIKIYAQKLEGYLKTRGFVGRMGGDNFLAIVKKDESDGFLEFLKRIYITTRVEDEDIKIHVKSRCGICGASPEIEYREMISRTTTALQRAKDTNKYVIYADDEMMKEFVDNKDTIALFKEGLMHDEFVPYYQPKVDAKTGKLCGAEALVRWNRDGKVVPPVKFIPVLEKEGRITSLDFYIFERVCQDLRKWIDEGKTPYTISSNFSKANLDDPDFGDKIIKLVKKYDLKPELLQVELTESIDSDNKNNIIAFSKVIRKYGVGLAIDDFGTGYSSLSVLREYNADVIKLDKSFLDSAVDDEANKTFIYDIIKLIYNQNQTIICEGVETKEQLDFLRDAGCDMIQGFYYDKPLPIEEFEKRLANPQY